VKRDGICEFEKILFPFPPIPNIIIILFIHRFFDMRIRKDAKISPLLFTCSSSLLQNDSLPVEPFQMHVCQLNQSPWDVIPFHFDNSSIQFEDSLAALDESVAWMMETDVVDIDNKPEIDNSSIMAIDDNQQRDGNKKVVNNNGGCNKGLKRNSNGGGDIEAPRRGRGRPKKVAADSASGSNNNEFYFYSGFGPPRGKRRGDKNDGEDNKSVVALGTSSDDVKVNVGVDVPCSEGLDYFEDYEDEYDDGNGKRRMRKPVKERSLKSLM